MSAQVVGNARKENVWFGSEQNDKKM